MKLISREDPLLAIEVRTYVEELEARMDLLRETARELDLGTIHRCHAANRLRKIANEIAAAR